MRSTLIGLAMSFGLSLVATTAVAQSPADPEIVQLQREIAETEAMIAKWTANLTLLEERLAKAQLRLRGGYLRFPANVERAMIGEAEARAQRLIGPRRPAIQRGDFVPRGVPRP